MDKDDIMEEPEAEAASTGEAESLSIGMTDSPSGDDEAGDSIENLDNIVLALLFSADETLSTRKMAAVIEDASVEEIKKSVEQWRVRLDEEAWSICVESVAGGYRLATRPNYATYLARLYSGKRKLRLSRAALETMAIVAYKQPITRAEIENVRGVSSGGVITNLMERSLVKIVGKAKVLGAPFLYGSTPEFLEYLGLDSLKDLPNLEELESLLEKEAFPDVETAQVAASSDEDISADEDDLDTEPGTDVAEALDHLRELATKAHKAEQTGPGNVRAGTTASEFTVQFNDGNKDNDKGEVDSKESDEEEGGRQAVASATESVEDKDRIQADQEK